MCGMWFPISTLTLRPHNVRGETVFRDREKSIPAVFLRCYPLYTSVVEDRLLSSSTESGLTHRPRSGQLSVGIFDKKLENYRRRLMNLLCGFLKK